MIPIKTSVSDIQKVLGYLSRQIGWVESAKAEKALGSVDDRKLSAMVEFGLVLRDNGNIRSTERGQLFASGQQIDALKQVLRNVELYRATIEWAHYGSRSEVTATEVGQYWEASHADTVGSVRGTTLKDGAVCFGRIVEGAGLGTLTLGRGGKETRISFQMDEVENLVLGVQENQNENTDPTSSEESISTAVIDEAEDPSLTGNLKKAPQPRPSVSVSASPSVHVNVEIHIAADATADTVREIFKNMARYVLDKPVSDEIN